MSPITRIVALRMVDYKAGQIKRWIYNVLISLKSLSYLKSLCVSGSSTDYVPLINLGGRFQFLSNGTLWIESALPYDEGNYMCKSENGVGSPLTKTIFVSVNGEFSQILT